MIEQHGVRPAEAALVSIHPWNVQGAVNAGLSGAWVNRTGRRHPGGSVWWASTTALE